VDSSAADGTSAPAIAYAQRTASFGSDGTVEYRRAATSEAAGSAAGAAPPSIDTPPESAAAPAETVEYRPGRAKGHQVDHQAATARKEPAPTTRPAQEPEAAAAPLAGGHPATFAGYDVLSVLGRGGMGVVYKARQRGLNRLVALKMISSGVHADVDELARFRSEAEAVAHLQHPNIVQIYEVGEEDGRPFFSLEFVDGVSLAKKIQDAPLPPREAARLAQVLALAMAYAHGRGIIHRDLKPANVLLTADGTPKIGDFGLAKRLEDVSQTRTGTVLGTPSYMAPEQTEGNSDAVGPLADVYALGAMLYDLLTGRAPFRGTTVLDTLEQVRVREPVPPVQLQPGVPRDLETICLKCLQKDPGRRYASATALAEDLGRFLRGEPILARPVSRGERLWRWCKRNPRTAGLSAAVMLLIAVWAITSSVLAGLLKAQKDQADRQTELAVKSDKEARRQAGIARANEERARRGMLIAEENEKRAKDSAAATIRQLVDLGEKLHKRLEIRKLAAAGSPEVTRLRADLLATLRQALAALSKDVERLGVTPFARVATCQAMGDLLARLGQGEEALRVYRQGYEAAKDIADADPRNDVARANLGVMLLRLGNVALEVNGDARAARRYYSQARDLHRDIRANPRSGFYKELDMKRILAHDDVALGQALLAAGRPSEARAVLQEALTYRLDCSAAEPKNVSARSYVMQARLWLGVAAGQRGDAGAVEEQFGQAARLGADLIRLFPKSAEFKEDLAETQGHYGDALLRLGKAAAADISYRDSLKNLEAALALRPDELSPQRLLARTHERLGSVSAVLGKAPQAEQHYREALKRYTELVAVETDSPARQVDRLLALARAGQCADAAAGAAKLRPKVAQSTQLQLQLARCWAVCAARDPAQKAQHAERALQTLRAATGDDYKDVLLLQNDPDLLVLRADPGFQGVIAAVKSRNP